MATVSGLTRADLWEWQYQSELDRNYYETLRRENDIRVFEQEKQAVYYKGNYSELLRYMQDALKKTWDEFSIKRMPKSYVNVTQKIIDSLAIIYRESPKRRIYNSDSSLNEELTEYYEQLLPKDVNKIDQATHRFAKLHNTSVPFLAFDSMQKRFTQRVSHSFLYNVYPVLENSDSQHIGKITYNKYFYEEKDNNYVLYTVVWTDEEYYRIFQGGDPVPMPHMEDIENPYGIIPVPFMRFEAGEDFWGEGQNILVNENEQINVLLSKLNYDDLILGTGGILFGVDLGEIKTNVEDSSGSILGGRDVILNARSNPDGTKTPSLSFVSTNPQVEAVTRAIDWKIKMIAQSMGLNPNNFTTELRSESGFARIVASFEQSEVRKDDLYSCNEYEERRFNIIRQMNNNLASSNFEGTQGLKNIPEDVYLRVDFVEVDIPLTTADMWLDRAEREKRGMGDNVDWMLEDNPDLRTREEAISILDAKQEEKNENENVQGQVETPENQNQGITLNDLFPEEQ